ncbi:MAG: ATP synthase F0 subunit B, partial [Deltaproteobacteria bacterium]|nr:ATP synthase F0 subunit B [Deltaproteobacteria bacterium]
MHKFGKIGPMGMLILFLVVAISLSHYGPSMAYASEQAVTHDSTAVTADEGGHGDTHGADRKGDLLDLLWRFINFALLVIILGWGMKKAGVKNSLASRVKDIKQRLEDLKNEKEASESKYRDIEAKLQAFEKEKRRIIEEYKREGQAEKDKIITEAKARVEQIIDQAELKIQQEIQSARDRLKGEVVDLAAEKAQD